MMVRGFREVGWVAAVAGTALGCYMVSLQVASERAALEQVENRIVLAKRDIRVLQTEIGTRGRLEQLESWNVKVLALSAPQAHQFLEGEFQLATLAAPKETIDPAAPVVLAAAPAPGNPTAAAAEPSARTPGGATARELMQVASLERTIPESEQKAVDKPRPEPVKTVKTVAKPATAPAKPQTAKAAPTTAPKAKPATTAASEPKARVASAASKTKSKPKTPAATTSKPKDTKARQ